MRNFRYALLFVLFLSFSNGFSQNRSIQFLEKPWQEILQIAKKENKLIFMDAYAVWCGPCKWMAANIFTNDTVADYFNKTFICVKVDMEKGEGRVLGKKFEVKAYPTLLFIDTAGALIHKKVGADRKAQDYIKMALTAQDPEECLAHYLSQYKAGNRTPAFMMTYFDRISDTYTPVNESLNQYFSTVVEATLSDRINWNIIYKYVNDKNSKEFSYLLKNADKYERLYTIDSVNQKIWQVYTNEFIQLIRSQPFSQEKYSRLKEEVLKSGYRLAIEVTNTADQWLQQFREQNK